MKISWSYLQQKFPPDVRAEIFSRIDRVVAAGDFTLGKEVGEFETAFAAKIGIKHAIGVGNGTDALKLSLLAAGIGHGDEVITAANTFLATAGAICEVGATPVFIDVTDNFCMDASKIGAAITENTKAIMPVQWGGQMADMDAVWDIVLKNPTIIIIEDAAQGIMSSQITRNTGFQRKAGTWGHLAAFSLHPLKNLSVWGDGGVIVTDDDNYADWIRKYRNHGMIARNTCEFAGCNSRLDTVQAVVGLYMLEQIDWITEQRIKHAAFLDEQLAGVKGVTLSQRFGAERVLTYTLYENFFERRDELQAFLKENGIEALVHYPQPCYWNEAFQFGTIKGDLPVTDAHVQKILTLPAHEHMTQEELQYVADKVKEFYAA